MILLLACTDSTPVARVRIDAEPTLTEAWFGAPAGPDPLVLELRFDTALPVCPRADADCGPRRITLALGSLARAQGVALAVHDIGSVSLGDPLSAPDLGPLAAWLRDAAVPARDGVTLAFVPALAGRSSSTARLFGVMSGLALSPEALRIEAEATRLPLDLPVDFTPTVLLSWEELSALPPERAAEVALHELGHAGGLPHVPDRTNLMSEQRGETPEFTEAQQRALR